MNRIYLALMGFVMNAPIKGNEIINHPAIAQRCQLFAGIDTRKFASVNQNWRSAANENQVILEEKFMNKCIEDKTQDIEGVKLDIFAPSKELIQIIDKKIEALIQEDKDIQDLIERERQNTLHRGKPITPLDVDLSFTFIKFKNLYWNHIGSKAVQYFEIVDLINLPITTIPADFGTQSMRIKQLRLPSAKLAFFPFLDNTSVEILDLRNMQLTDFEWSFNSPQLRKLFLPKTTKTITTALVQDCPNLTELNLYELDLDYISDFFLLTSHKITSVPIKTLGTLGKLGAKPVPNWIKGWYSIDKIPEYHSNLLYILSAPAIFYTLFYTLTILDIGKLGTQPNSVVIMSGITTLAIQTPIKTALFWHKYFKLNEPMRFIAYPLSSALIILSLIQGSITTAEYLSGNSPDFNQNLPTTFNNLVNNFPIQEIND